jgi:hypothetical protein
MRDKLCNVNAGVRGMGITEAYRVEKVVLNTSGWCP